MKVLHISAGGKCTRISGFLQANNLRSKHLIPIPTKGKTIIGEILHRASGDFDRLKVWVSKENIQDFVPMIHDYQKSHYIVDFDMTGPLGPVVRHIVKTGTRGYACAGDHYADFSWAEMETFHNSHDYPVTVLIARSLPFDNAATFKVARSGGITSWARVARSTDEDLVNIGGYIFDPTPELMAVLSTILEHKEDEVFDLLIKHKLIAGFVPSGQGFNVNTEETYLNLLQMLK